MIEEIWYGNLNPSEDFYDTENKELKRVSSNINRTHLEICKRIEEPLSSKFDFYENQRELQLQLMCKEAFKRGFELGVKISAEALGES